MLLTPHRHPENGHGEPSRCLIGIKRRCLGDKMRAFILEKYKELTDSVFLRSANWLYLLNYK